MSDFDDLLKGLMAAKPAEMAETKKPEEQLKEAAVGMKGFYDSFVAAGFTSSQALQLTCAMVSAVVGNSKGGR